jgi:hypothetical protein
MKLLDTERTRAQQSRAAIEKLYITMRHLFNRGKYKPMGVSGDELRNALLVLRPEIYGSIADPEKVELEGLLYVIERLPRGIEECRFIKLVSDEGLSQSHFEAIIPRKRRRNCYRIDQEQMFIELTRGRSDIYDILTHLTFMYNEAEKIKNNTLDSKGNRIREWIKLEEFVLEQEEISGNNQEMIFTYLSTLLGRTYEEVYVAYEKFTAGDQHNNLFHVVYWLGKLAMDELNEKKNREISFSATLRERIGHHIYGEIWAGNIKKVLFSENLLNRPLHIISSNLHSVMNCLYANSVLQKASKKEITFEEIARDLSQSRNMDQQLKVEEYALRNGMISLDDNSATNISVQIFDCTKLNPAELAPNLRIDLAKIKKEKPVLLVMNYAFGEQAFEIMDELLKSFMNEGSKIPMPVASISIMGKAGILEGGKGDIMIPTSFVFEGTADNYPIQNKLSAKDFSDSDSPVQEGTMITVLGTSLQNRDILEYFKKSSWKAIGLEMEGAHLQKAIQAASKIRKSIDEGVEIRCAYYASDNPLVTGSTLASGSLGLVGVKPTYLITSKILNQILG